MVEDVSLMIAKEVWEYLLTTYDYDVDLDDLQNIVGETMITNYIGIETE